jgi:hypothetical protein
MARGSGGAHIGAGRGDSELLVYAIGPCQFDGGPCKLELDTTKSIPILHLHPVCSMDQTHSEPSIEIAKIPNMSVDGSDVKSEV